MVRIHEGRSAKEVKKKKFFSQGFLPKIKKLLGGEKEKK